MISVFHHQLRSSSAHRGSPLQTQQQQDQIDVVVVVCCAEQLKLGLPPRRVPEAELEQVVPPQHRLLMAERVEGVLAVVPPEPALSDTSKWQRVQQELRARGQTGGRRQTSAGNNRSKGKMEKCRRTRSGAVLFGLLG